MTRRFALAFAAGLLAAATSAPGADADSATLSPVTLACPAGALASGAVDRPFALAGWPDRDYDLVLPATYRCGAPVAVAIVFHGGGGNKEGMRKIACPDGDLASAGCLHRVVLAAGMAIVFANGTNTPGSKLINPRGLRTWNAGGGQQGAICGSGQACTRGIADVAYARALVADLGTRIAVDTKRIFATGFSNGASLAQRLGCEAADLFAAIAPVAGENQFSLAGCSPTQAVAVLDIHGTLDKCWPYPGGMGGCIQSGRYVSVEFSRRLGRPQRLQGSSRAGDAAGAAQGERRHQRRSSHLVGMRRGRGARTPRGRRQRPLPAERTRVRAQRDARRRNEPAARHRAGDRRFLPRQRSPVDTGVCQERVDKGVVD